jgi:methylated-DNA-[protein]-cysteine S-methyltransferase
MAEMCTYEYQSPIGLLEIIGDEHHILSILFQNFEPDEGMEMKGDEKNSGSCLCEVAPEPIMKCVRQLDEYFAGTRKEFDLPLRPVGTPFQMKVWKALQKIKYGKTRSYKDIAGSIKNPNAVRAVGGANGKNPISIVIPCHRVITNDGKIGGYGGGLWRKEWLLDHESKGKKGNAMK